MTPETILWGLGGLAVILLLIRFIVLKAPRISGGPDVGSSMTIGSREVQEDQVGTLYTNSGLLTVLADGMGKEYGGRIASRAAVGGCDQCKEWIYFGCPKKKKKKQTEGTGYRTQRYRIYL